MELKPGTKIEHTDSGEIIVVEKVQTLWSPHLSQFQNQVFFEGYAVPVMASMIADDLNAGNIKFAGCAEPSAADRDEMYDELDKGYREIMAECTRQIDANSDLNQQLDAALAENADQADELKAEQTKNERLRNRNATLKTELAQLRQTAAAQGVGGGAEWK